MIRFCTILIIIISCGSCYNRTEKKSSQSYLQGGFDTLILGNWSECIEGYYYEIYYTDSFEIVQSWLYTNYFLPEEDNKHAISHLRRYRLEGDSIFFFDFYTPESIGKIAFPTVNELKIHETYLDSYIEQFSWREKERQYIVTRLPDSILLPPMKFESDKFAWWDWWDENSYAGFKSRALRANCLDVFNSKQIDSMRTEFLNNWYDTSKLYIFDLDDTIN